MKIHTCAHVFVSSIGEGWELFGKGCLLDMIVDPVVIGRGLGQEDGPVEPATAHGKTHNPGLEPSTVLQANHRTTRVALGWKEECLRPNRPLTFGTCSKTRAAGQPCLW